MSSIATTYLCHFDKTSGVDAELWADPIIQGTN
jgi:hypothetical protein